MNSIINRRRALASLGTAASFPFLARHTTGAANNSPNVVLLLADDLHLRALGCQGNPQVHTPNIDRLAAEGMRFTNCHVSNPICSPSRAAMLTGQYGFQNGVTFFGDRIHEDSPRMAEHTANQGYQTAYTGKWHNNGRPLDHGFTRMRHVFLGGMHDYDSIPVANQQHDSPYEIKRNPTEVFTEGAIRLLNDMDDDPFMLMCGFTAPHDPRVAPPEYEAVYNAQDISLPNNFMRQPAFDPGTLNIRDEQLMRRPLDPNALKREIAKYYAMITHMDDQIGLILESLKRSGRMDNTYIIFASDNGLALGSHGLLGKQTMYEEGIRVPLIVKGPGILPNSESDALVDLMDLAPTMIELAGGSPPQSMQAKSLRPMLFDDADYEERNYLFGHYDDPRSGGDGFLFRMVKDKHYKLIRHLKSGKEELFDLQYDPYEMNDLSESEDHTDIKKRLKAGLKEWQQSVNDPALKS